MEVRYPLDFDKRFNANYIKEIINSVNLIYLIRIYLLISDQHAHLKIRYRI